MNLSSKRSQVIILVVLFFVFAGAGGFLLWRVNQPETVAPEESEAWSQCYTAGEIGIGTVLQICGGGTATVAAGSCYKASGAPDYCWASCTCPAPPIPPGTDPGCKCCCGADCRSGVNDNCHYENVCIPTYGCCDCHGWKKTGSCYDCKQYGTCGSLNGKVFPSTATSWPTGTFCGDSAYGGTVSPSSPSFPSPGQTTTWTCNAPGGAAPGRSINCSARTQAVGSYTVTYSPGAGGSCTPTSRSVTSGGNSAAPSCTREGYTLSEFSRTSGSGGTLNKTTGAVTGVTGNQTITANWQINKYTVTYSAGTGGSCTPSTRSVNHGDNSAAPTCTREGYTLLEFSRTSGDGGTLDAKTGAVTGVTGDQTITASWDAIPDPGCGNRAGTYPYTTTTWPAESTEWCEIGEASEFDPNQQFPSPGQSISWKCVSGTTTANCSAKTEKTPDEPVIPETPTVPETGIFDDTKSVLIMGIVLLVLGFTWRYVGYYSVKLSIHIRDVREDIRMKKRVSQLRKTDKRRKNFEKKVVKH